jgi:beta-lactamase superfamily II metal-dependent hydrolase
MSASRAGGGGIARGSECGRSVKTVADLTIIYMDAGQGDCTLILFPDGATNWMIDCGSIKNGAIVSPQITTVLKRVLSTRGNCIHRLILTHPDQDHYNLLSSVAPTFPIGEIVYGGAMDQYKNQLDKNYTYNLLVKYGTKAISPNATVNWSPTTIGGADVKFLAANASGSFSDTNNNSIVLMITYLTYKFLLLGDAEEPTENFILSHWDAKDLTSDFGVALKMGHHGSDSSSSEAWVKTVKPTALTVSADTRGFGKYGRSMPANSKINNAVNWSGRVANLANTLNHSYVVWCDDCDPNSNFYLKPMLVGPTLQAICTSLYDLQYNFNYTTFASTGGSWYFTVSNPQNPTLTVEWTGS